jgi:hypothetical protein
MGSALPFLEKIDPQGVLDQGTWEVIFVRRDCPDCLQELDSLNEFWPGTATREADGRRLAVVELPPFSSTAPPLLDRSVGRELKLLDDDGWFFRTPARLLLKEGIVVGSLENAPK